MLPRESIAQVNLSSRLNAVNSPVLVDLRFWSKMIDWATTARYDSPMHTGFTGTQRGMTPHQKSRVRRLLHELLVPDRGNYAHHGDCVGADADFHALAESRGYHLVGHPPDNPAKRAFCDFDELWPEKPYRIRNKDIVDQCDLLLACPRRFTEMVRSGTWMTIRMAWRIEKPVIIVWPDGSTG